MGALTMGSWIREGGARIVFIPTRGEACYYDLLFLAGFQWLSRVELSIEGDRVLALSLNAF